MMIDHTLGKSELHSLSYGIFFEWHWNSPRGRSGGILVGVNKDNFDVVHVEHVVYFLRVLVYDRCAKFSWNLVAVYGDAQNEGKASFLAELARLYQDNSLSCLIGCDFNIIRNESEKK